MTPRTDAAPTIMATATSSQMDFGGARHSRTQRPQHHCSIVEFRAYRRTWECAHMPCTQASCGSAAFCAARAPIGATDSGEGRRRRSGRARCVLVSPSPMHLTRLAALQHALGTAPIVEGLGNAEFSLLQVESCRPSSTASRRRRRHGAELVWRSIASVAILAASI